MDPYLLNGFNSGGSTGLDSTVWAGCAQDTVFNYLSGGDPSSKEATQDVYTSFCCS